MKMTDIMKKSHSESKSENLDAILQKIDNKAFITNSADSAPVSYTHLQGPGTYSPQHADLRLLAIPTSCRRVAAYNPN